MRLPVPDSSGPSTQQHPLDLAQRGHETTFVVASSVAVVPRATAAARKCPTLLLQSGRPEPWTVAQTASRPALRPRRSMPPPATLPQGKTRANSSTPQPHQPAVQTPPSSHNHARNPPSSHAVVPSSLPFRPSNLPPPPHTCYCSPV
jgi:hypothetical protein